MIPRWAGPRAGTASFPRRGWRFCSTGVAGPRRAAAGAPHPFVRFLRGEAARVRLLLGSGPAGFPAPPGISPTFARPQGLAAGHHQHTTEAVVVVAIAGIVVVAVGRQQVVAVVVVPRPAAQHPGASAGRLPPRVSRPPDGPAAGTTPRNLFLPVPHPTRKFRPAYGGKTTVKMQMARSLAAGHHQHTTEAEAVAANAGKVEV